MGPYYITLHAGDGCVAWDLRSGTPDGTSVRVASGDAHSWPAACHQAGNALDKQAQAHRGRVLK